MKVRNKAQELTPGKTLLYAVLIIVYAISLFPFCWMTITSFKTEGEIWRNPYGLFPKDFSLANYRSIMSPTPFTRIFLNTIVFAVGVALFSIPFDSMASYSLAVLRVPGSKILLIIFLATPMIPFQITMIPLYLLLDKMDWLNTYVGLIVPRATSTFGIFLFYQFFRTLPKDLEDAARIDGCPVFRTYWNIIMPLSIPPIVTFGVITFMFNWNDFIWPLIITSDREMFRLPVALALFRGQHVTGLHQLA